MRRSPQIDILQCEEEARRADVPDVEGPRNEVKLVNEEALVLME